MNVFRHENPDYLFVASTELSGVTFVGVYGKHCDNNILDTLSARVCNGTEIIPNALSAIREFRECVNYFDMRTEGVLRFLDEVVKELEVKKS